jgi:hypothetical protein
MTTKYADNPATENAKKVLEEEKKVSDRSRAAYAERSKGKPTPTQEENDIAMLGGHVIEHEDDGSGPEPLDYLHPELGHKEAKHVEADRRPSNYATRQTTAKHSE